MVDTGFVRKIDINNKITIPRGILKELGIEESDKLRIFIYGNGIFLKKA